MKKIFVILVILFLYSGNIANAMSCRTQDHSLDFLNIFGIPPQLILNYSETDQIYFGLVTENRKVKNDCEINISNLKINGQLKGCTTSYDVYEIKTFLPLRGNPEKMVNYSTSHICDNFSFSKYGIYLIYSNKLFGEDKYYINYSFSILWFVVNILIRVIFIIFIIKLVKFIKKIIIKKIKNN